MRVAAVGDLHAGRPEHRGLLARLGGVVAEADVLLLAGDLTDHGRPEEALELAAALGRLRIPIVTVLGNHDFEGGRPFAIADALEQAGVRVLDGTTYRLGELGVAGIKGFCGGFDPHRVEGFGERVLKEFVQECESEAVKLEQALQSLTTRHRVALLHYAPIAETLAGESREVLAFLGSSRFGEVLDRAGATLALHGHGHAGEFAGTTPGGVRVYNVAVPVLRRLAPPRDYALFELPD